MFLVRVSENVCSLQGLWEETKDIVDDKNTLAGRGGSCCICVECGLDLGQDARIDETDKFLDRQR